MERYLRFPGGKGKALTFSYDDGDAADIRLIDIFRKHGMKGTFNLNSGVMGAVGKLTRVTAEDAPGIYTEDVCEVACHALTHAVLKGDNPIEVWNQVLQDRINLEKIFNRQIHGLAYPYGSYDDTVVDILKNAGIYYARTTEPIKRFTLSDDWLRMPVTCHHGNPELMAHADKFLASKVQHSPRVFFVWGHSFEFNKYSNWNLIEDFCEKMAFKDDIWYATNIEIYYAWLDYQRLETSADGKTIYNPSVRSVWIGDAKYNTWEIKPGETITI